MGIVSSLAWRLFKHEAKRGELTIILLAIVLSVASVLSLSLFSERLQGALQERSASFLAADTQLRASQPIEGAWVQQAHEDGLDTASQVATRSMAFGETQMSLVDLRAVNENYPLKGTILVADAPFGEAHPADNLPQPGEAWIDSRLFQLLDVSIGGTIYVGDASFRVSGVLSEIPDAGFSLFTTEPIVLIRQRDVASADITGPGSRVTYKTYFTGDEQNLSQFYDWLRPQLNDELHRWQAASDDDSPIGRSVKRAERYFLLASLLAIILAAVSIAVAAQRYSQRHFDPVAIMKTLGASKTTIRRIYTLQICFITLLGIVLGVIAGMIIQQVVITVLAANVEVSLDVWHWRPILMAIFTGVVCALLFSLYPLLQLFSVPPLRVLRRDMSTNLQAKSLQFLAAGGAIFALMWTYSQDLKISAILFISGIALVAGLMVVTVGLIRIGRKLGSGSMGPWRLAWARISRRAMDNSVQLISFSVTLLLLLVVLVMRNDMVEQWRAQLPEGTPNYFLINITETQKPELEAHFAQNDVQTSDFFPVVRGRFVAVNGERVNTEVSKDDDDGSREGRTGLGREANLTWSNTLQSGNEIVAGNWQGNQVEKPTDGIYPVSVESDVAERLGIELGDLLTFNIGSEEVQSRVTSLRKVDWQTMQPNFFFVLSPAAMQDFSPTYITSFYLPSERKQALTALLQPFASTTLFDVDARINQLRDIVEQVSLAVEFILILVLAAGALVLIAQVQASMDERQQELAILRTLGAKGSLIRLSVVYEFIIIGIVAGFMAALANELSLYMLQTEVFQMQASLHPQFWIIAPTVGAIVVGALGAIGCWRLLSLNTTTLLRKMI
ncbi:FtsX-like permease family protein [Alteromonas sp. C1M14]|uniref:ABC transporter permease n=1 Tax=Alteromonas sp. C1M14 TaxID=2841567 RepID=UPI001C091FF1|nr:FtsX-like permease family protein [Alteromonas sp. C1M14]MBU2977469.1 FtsX-like permease family protein [Alteromonas sp. C1M14]